MFVWLRRRPGRGGRRAERQGVRDMSEQEEPVGSRRHLTELFAALKEVVAGNERIQRMIRTQERDNRQVLLNMSSVLRMVEREQEARDQGVPAERYEPKVVAGWMMNDGTMVGEKATAGPEEGEEPAAETDGPARDMNFFDRAFLRSLKISS